MKSPIVSRPATKQEWVQCDKCEKWRRLPPRISPEDLPDVWYCSMNTWDVNLATCTAVEEKHDANPSPSRSGAAATEPARSYSEQSQIPTSFGPSSKLSYRNLIFGSGRRQKYVSERTRAQESLFAGRDGADGDMSTPRAPYADSDVFCGKGTDGDGAAGGRGVFDIVSHSRAWRELGASAGALHGQGEFSCLRPAFFSCSSPSADLPQISASPVLFDPSLASAASRSVGYEQFCQPNGSLKQETVDMLKAMAYMCLDEEREIPAHEVLLQIQCQDWDHIPSHWLELRALVNVEIVTSILEELASGGIVDAVQHGMPGMLAVDAVLYRKSRGFKQREENVVTSSKRPSVLKDRWLRC